jgi:TonB family protein
VNVIGKDQLARERRADGERRKSQHAGTWRPVGIERWRAAIENYVASVKPGNQTALNTARAPFANYLVQIHNRIHPIFAETFLDSLDSLPNTHPLNRPEITTNIEIVLDREEGRIERMGITKTSGVTAFDVAALESVHRAQPFGAPPREIVSPDGSVYFHWEFHRNRDEACSTYFARPFILKGQPKSVPPSLPPSKPAPESEGQERHGQLFHHDHGHDHGHGHDHVTVAARAR